MKKILLFICVLTLLSTTGCIMFPGHGDRSDNQGGPGFAQHDDHSAGVDHGEHPGDEDHGDTTQR